MKSTTDPINLILDTANRSTYLIKFAKHRLIKIITNCNRLLNKTTTFFIKLCNLFLISSTKRFPWDLCTSSTTTTNLLCFSIQLVSLTAKFHHLVITRNIKSVVKSPTGIHEILVRNHESTFLNTGLLQRTTGTNIIVCVTRYATNCCRVRRDKTKRCKRTKGSLNNVTLSVAKTEQDGKFPILVQFVTYTGGVLPSLHPRSVTTNNTVKNLGVKHRVRRVNFGIKLWNFYRFARVGIFGKLGFALLDSIH